MSSVTRPQSEQPSEHDELVAYLDGELGPDECRAVEERLANDAEYRQQLRDLDQAWEALAALPATAVDDGFARTTIELACVAAEEDLSQRTVAISRENRGRWRWWIAASVAAAVMGFLMVRALSVHRNNLLLADLPVIAEVYALEMVPNVEFLRQLSAAGFDKEAIKDEPSFKRALGDFTQANSASLDERQAWVESLKPEQKADLAERARAFELLSRKQQETERVRRLTQKIGGEPALQATLVAYGQWLSRHHSPGEREQLRSDFAKLSSSEQVDEIQHILRREREQQARRLSPEDKPVLRQEIIELAKKKKADLMARLPAGETDRIAKIDPTNGRVALFFILRELQDDETIERILGKLSDEARTHYRALPNWPRDRRRRQLSEWMQEATETRLKPEDLEQFFATSDKISADLRQKLLDMPREEMRVALERLYLKTELGIEEPWPLMREFGEGRRGPRDGPRDGGNPDGRPDRRRDGPPPRGPDGPPRNDRIGPDGGPPEFDPDRPRLGPGGRPVMRPEDGPDGDRRRRPPNNQGPLGPAAELDM
jgi:hypothetical protein